MKPEKMGGLMWPQPKNSAASGDGMLSATTRSSMNCRHPVVCDVVVVLPPPPLHDLLPAAGSAAVLSASHKCGSGRDRTPTMHRLSMKKCMTFSSYVLSAQWGFAQKKFKSHQLVQKCSENSVKKAPKNWIKKTGNETLIHQMAHCAVVMLRNSTAEKINTGPHMKWADGKTAAEFAAQEFPHVVSPKLLSSWLLEFSPREAGRSCCCRRAALASTANGTQLCAITTSSFLFASFEFSTRHGLLHGQGSVFLKCIFFTQKKRLVLLRVHFPFSSPLQ